MSSKKELIKLLGCRLKLEKVKRKITKYNLKNQKLILKTYDLNSFLRESDCVVDIQNAAEGRANVFKKHLQEIDAKLENIDEAIKALDCSSPSDVAT